MFTKIKTIKIGSFALFILNYLNIFKKYIKKQLQVI